MINGPRQIRWKINICSWVDGGVQSEANDVKKINDERKWENL